MNFIALVIALLIERLLGEYERLRDWSWFTGYARWLKGAVPTAGPWAGTLSVLLLVALPVALTGIVYELLGGALLSIVALTFSVLVLVYSLGPREIDGEVDRYLDAVEAGDDLRATQAAHAIGGDVMPSGGAARNRALAEAILVEFNERSFAVLFWFVVLGPMGAVLFRLSSLARRGAAADAASDPGFADAALRLHGILNWIPARLLALGFALAGSFEDAITDWKAYHDRRAAAVWQANLDVIAATGRGALRIGNALESDDGSPTAGVGAVRSAVALALRTLVFWVVLYGLLTIAGLAI